MHGSNWVAAISADSAGDMKHHLSSPARTLAAAFVLAIVSLIATSATHAEPFAYVVNGDPASASVIDTASNVIVATVPVGIAIALLLVVYGGIAIRATNLSASDQNGLRQVDELRKQINGVHRLCTLERSCW